MMKMLRHRPVSSKERLRHSRYKQAGYSLLEMLVVMGIMAILTAIATPQVMHYFGKAKVQSAQLQIKNIDTALELYYMENGTYPDTDTGLKALIEAPVDAPNWNGPYLKQDKSLIDPWGHPYQYVFPNASNQYEVSTLGPSGDRRAAMADTKVVR